MIKNYKIHVTVKLPSVLLTHLVAFSSHVGLLVLAILAVLIENSRMKKLQKAFHLKEDIRHIHAIRIQHGNG